MTAEKDEISIEHSLGINNFEFFEQYDKLPTDIRWMVYKVKRKAEYDYNNVIAKSVDSAVSEGGLLPGANNLSLNELAYSYNWPYDFFSLVELSKLDVELGSGISPGSTLGNNQGDMGTNPASCILTLGQVQNIIKNKLQEDPNMLKPASTTSFLETLSILDQANMAINNPTRFVQQLFGQHIDTEGGGSKFVGQQEIIQLLIERGHPAHCFVLKLQDIGGGPG